MSDTPKPTDISIAATDPLGDALDRLEKSIEMNAPQMRRPSIPAPRREGESPRSLVPEGGEAPPAAPPVERSPVQVPPAPRAAPAPAPVAVPVPRPAVPDPASERVNGAAGEAAAAAPPPEIEGRRAEGPEQARKVAEVEAPAGREAVPKAVPLPPQPKVVAEGGSPRGGDTQRLDDDDLSPVFDDAGQAAISVRRGNRKVAPTSILIWVALVQVGVLAVAAAVAWPLLKRGLGGGGAGAAAPAERPDAALAEQVEAGLQKIAALEAELAEVRGRLGATPDKSWEEIEFLSGRNRLLELGDRAIRHADRTAYDRLRELAGSAPDERLRDGAAAEILRVGFAYSTGLRSESHTLPVGKLFPSLRDKDERALSTDQLVKVLGDTGLDAAHRVKAAYLLADRRGGKAADALAAAVAGDPDLDVVREAVMTFSEMTGYRTDDLLDADRLAAWWRTHTDRVKAVIGD